MALDVLSDPSDPSRATARSWQSTGTRPPAQNPVGSLAAIAAVASRQLGVVSKEQLIEAGLTTRSIERQAARGHLMPVFRGVYSIGHGHLSSRGHKMAAVLAAGEGAVISHRSAAEHFGLIEWEGPIDVSRAYGGRAGLRASPNRWQQNVRIHRMRAIPEAPPIVHGGVPSTSVERTLIDLASVVRPRLLEQAVLQASRLGLLRMDTMAQILRGQGSGRRGVGLLRQLLDLSAPEDARSRSDGEVQVLRLCKSHGLPIPLVNESVEGLEVDFLWKDKWLVAELDGRRHHRGRAAFERDRRRDRALVLAGYRVMRFTYGDIHGDAGGVADQLREMLAQQARRAESAG